MARKPRIHFPGAVYHVMLRGNGGQEIFYSSRDRSRMVLLLQAGVERYGHRIHAFCLMPNHIHLAIQVGETPLSKIMQNLSVRYTLKINASQKRSGHLFQGRYKAILIDADQYLLQLIRYIHNNPVRARLVDRCGAYPWSSHRAYCGEEVIPWVTTEWVMGQFAEQGETAYLLYRDFIHQGASEGQRAEFHQGSIEGRLLGDDHFAEEALTKAEQKFQVRHSLEQLIEAVCTVYRITPYRLAEPGRKRDLSEPRAVVAYMALEADHLTLTALAAALNRELSGLSQAAGRLQKRLASERTLGARLQEIKKLLQRSNCKV